jgi:hypothetical protein
MNLFRFYVFSLLLNLAGISSSCLAVELQSLHGNRGWTEHHGQLTVQSFSMLDSRLIYRAVCDATLITEYQSQGEVWTNGRMIKTPRAYFELRILDHCDEEILNSPTTADGWKPEPTNSTPVTLTVDLARISSSSRSYSNNDDVFLKTRITVGSDGVTEARSTHSGNLAFVTQINRVGRDLKFKYQSFQADDRKRSFVEFELFGQFRTLSAH